MTAELKLIYEHIFDMEDYLLSLIREKEIIQNIERERPDFADLQISHELLTKHIEEIREKLRNSKISGSIFPGEIEVYEEEEEEKTYSSSSKYIIEHLIEDEYGNLRDPVESDFYIHKHAGVRDAYKLFHRWQKYRTEGGRKPEYG